MKAGEAEAPRIRTALGGMEGYSLVDSGNRFKLERFGEVTVIRGEPKAWWKPALGEKEWDRAQAIHEEGQGWRVAKGCPREWTLAEGELRFRLRLSDTSKHLGVFPEQSPHWRAIRRAGRGGGEKRLLNLFGYTGAASLVAARAGWKVTHVDASKPATAWARENQRRSGMEEAPIRWIVEDAAKYVRREIRRGSRYEAVLLDPPAFGRGPTGQVWKVEWHLAELLELVAQVLSAEARLVVLTTYNIEASSLMLGNLLEEAMTGRGGRVETGELMLEERGAGGRALPLSIFARWERDAAGEDGGEEEEEA